MVKNNFGDSLAQSMSQVLNSEEHQRIFAKPKVATASSEKTAVQVAFESLLATSEKLDQMGLEKSALLVLKAAHGIASEAGLMDDFVALPGNEEKNPTLFLSNPEEEVSETGEEDELADLLEELGESNEVMEVPGDSDMPEGLETTE